jgi:hypothetical protein
MARTRKNYSQFGIFTRTKCINSREYEFVIVVPNNVKPLSGRIINITKFSYIMEFENAYTQIPHIPNKSFYENSTNDAKINVSGHEISINEYGKLCITIRYTNDDTKHDVNDFIDFSLFAPNKRKLHEISDINDENGKIPRITDDNVIITLSKPQIIKKRDGNYSVKCNFDNTTPNNSCFVNILHDLLQIVIIDATKPNNLFTFTVGLCDDIVKREFVATKHYNKEIGELCVDIACCNQTV